MPNSIVFSKKEYKVLVKELTQVHIKVDVINNKLETQNKRIDNLEDISGDLTQKEQQELYDRQLSMTRVEKWKDRFYMLGLNAIVFIIILILIRTGIINIQ